MSKGNELTEEVAETVYDVLVEMCGASEGARAGFVHSQTADYTTEWRFMGALGFGGKFWRNTGRRPDGSWGEVWYVNNYAEDRTPGTDSMCEAANAALWIVQQHAEVSR